VRAQQGFFLIERTCPTCGGPGQHDQEPLQDLRRPGRVQRERTLSVTIPPGVEDGTRIRLSGEGEAGAARRAGRRPLHLPFGLSARDLPARRPNIFCRVPLRMTQAALGGSCSRCRRSMAAAPA
jgi:molecular chaperone DnaJ